MAIKSIVNGFEVYTIVADDNQTRASFVPARGGVGSSIIMSYKGIERELLFLHDNFWQPVIKDLPGGWPFLFPICARLERAGVKGNYLYDGKIYHLDIHGFSWQLPWLVINNDRNDTLTMELTSNHETLKHYPFKFRILLKYQVSASKLICKQIYTNLDNKRMPYYAGFHPYFLTPAAKQGKEKVQLDFMPIRTLQYNEQLTDIIGEKATLKMPAAITDPNINEQLSEVPHDNISTLTYPDGFKLHMQLHSEKHLRLFPYVQLYTIPEKPFFCIEPWMSFPNALNSVFGARWLMPGHSDEATLELSGE
jgi:galactose mutarotase-like enzyme